ncbi:hypothetical protein GEMRC1_007812 [Eukaryota sp. GEM-RC1]
MLELETIAQALSTSAVKICSKIVWVAENHAAKSFKVLFDEIKQKLLTAKNECKTANVFASQLFVSNLGIIPEYCENRIEILNVFNKLRRKKQLSFENEFHSVVLELLNYLNLSTDKETISDMKIKCFQMTIQNNEAEPDIKRSRADCDCEISDLDDYVIDLDD